MHYVSKFRKESSCHQFLQTGKMGRNPVLICGFLLTSGNTSWIQFTQIGQHLSERTGTGGSHRVRASQRMVKVSSGAPVCGCEIGSEPVRWFRVWQSHRWEGLGDQWEERGPHQDEDVSQE